MPTKDDIKFAMNYFRNNKKEATKIIAQAIVITAISSVAMILVVKAATDAVQE